MMFRHALVGRQIAIVAAANTYLVGMQGKILHETRHMLMLKTSTGIKNVHKSNITLVINMDGNELTVSGKDLLGRVDERMKR